MASPPLQDLKRISESLDRLRDQLVLDVSVRSDCKQMRIMLEDGEILIISCINDGSGKPRLDVDLVRPTGETSKHQLEVSFEGRDRTPTYED